jgi:hypothetical protein
MAAQTLGGLEDRREGARRGRGEEAVDRQHRPDQPIGVRAFQFAHGPGDVMGGERRHRAEPVGVGFDQSGKVIVVGGPERAPVGAIGQGIDAERGGPADHLMRHARGIEMGDARINVEPVIAQRKGQAV